MLCPSCTYCAYRFASLRCDVCQPGASCSIRKFPSFFNKQFIKCAYYLQSFPPANGPGKISDVHLQKDYMARFVRCTDLVVWALTEVAQYLKSVVLPISKDYDFSEASLSKSFRHRPIF